MATDHRPSGGRWVGRIAAVALIGLVAGGSVASAIHVQNELTNQAQTVLDEAGIPADVRYSGLDATISGWASDAEMRRGADLVRAVKGTRSVSLESTEPDGELETNAPESTPYGPSIPSSTSPATASPSPTTATPSPTPTTTAPLPTVDIYFQGSSSTLLVSQAAKLPPVAAWMKTNPTARVEVRGHTDNGLTAAQRESLSRRRAQAVVAALQQQGVPGERLVIRALGSGDRAADNETKQGRAQNRRVDFAIVRS